MEERIIEAKGSKGNKVLRRRTHTQQVFGKTKNKVSTRKETSAFGKVGRLETKQHGNRATASFWEGWKQRNNWKQDRKQEIGILEGWKVGNKVGNKAAKAGNKDRKEESNNTRQQVFLTKNKVACFGVAKAGNKNRKEEGNNIRQQVFGLGTRQQVLGLPRLGTKIEGRKATTLGNKFLD